MEMHQVRYFLAVARILNFTRAADECNVTQPSLTRAIKQLEAEMGGDLFRRERPTQLTELGQRMHPLLKQCYDAAVGARSLASSFKSGELGALRIALTHSVDISLLIPFLNQIKRQFNRLEFKFLRGNRDEVVEMLRKGEAELGIAAELDDWDRLDSWPLFTEDFRLVVSKGHRLAGQRPASKSTICAPNNCCREIIASTRPGSAIRFASMDSTLIAVTKSPRSAT